MTTETDEQPLPPLPPWAIPVCRLWRRTQASDFALAGRLGAAKVYVFANPDKRSAGDADFFLCIASPSPTVRAMEALATNRAALLTEQMSNVEIDQ